MDATERLKEEHVQIARLLDILDVMSQRLETPWLVSADHLQDALELIRVWVSLCHFGKEELVLFPALEDAGLPPDNGPLPDLNLEHSAVRELEERLREAIVRFAAGDHQAAFDIQANARNYMGLLGQHITKENEMIFPLAEEYLESQDEGPLLAEYARFDCQAVSGQPAEHYLGLLNHLRQVYLE